MSWDDITVQISSNVVAVGGALAGPGVELPTDFGQPEWSRGDSAPLTEAQRAWMTRFGSPGDAGLAALYENVHRQIQQQLYPDAAVVAADAGHSWFEAPGSSAGSFSGLRYGDIPLAQSFSAVGAFHGAPADADLNLVARASVLTAPASAAGSYPYERFGSTVPLASNAPAYMADEEASWRAVAARPATPPSSFDAPASSAGSFTGLRFGDMGLV